MTHLNQYQIDQASGPAAPHTPGPWEQWGEGKEIGIGPAAGGVAVCDVTTTTGEGFYRPHSAAQGEANARLIAAAPDLLAFVREFYLHVSYFKYDFPAEILPEHKGEYTETLFDMAGAILAKVKGGAQ